MMEMTTQEASEAPYNEFLRGLNYGKREVELELAKAERARQDSLDWAATLKDRQHRREQLTARGIVGAVLLTVITCFGIMAKCSSTYLPAGCYEINSGANLPQDVKGIPCPSK